ncbi:hypothetical protein [Halogeometricum rufum]|nr:hypothetical protein [Halogeometricum rufum]
MRTGGTEIALSRDSPSLDVVRGSVAGATTEESISGACYRFGTTVEVMFGVVVSYGGLRGEIGTIRRTLRRTDEFRPESELVTELAGFVRVNADRLKRDAEGRELDRVETVARSHDSCREATAVVRERATAEEREEYGRFVRWCAERVVDAGVEGGVLRFGGRRVSPAERAFVDSIADAFDTAGHSTEPDG